MFTSRLERELEKANSWAELHRLERVALKIVEPQLQKLSEALGYGAPERSKNHVGNDVWTISTPAERKSAEIVVVLIEEAEGLRVMVGVSGVSPLLCHTVHQNFTSAPPDDQQVEEMIESALEECAMRLSRPTAPR